MNKKEELELKFKILHEALNSDNPSKVFKEYEEKYPEILDETLVRLNKEKEADNSKKRKLNKIQDEVNLDIIDMNDNCTYYKFQFGIIGKYDPDKSNYYIYEDNTWKISGNVMRWVEDAGYEYEIIKKIQTTK